MVDKKRFMARTEPFGMTLYDKYDGQIFVLKDVHTVGRETLLLRSGPETKEVHAEDIDFIPAAVKRKDILSGPTYAEIYPTLTCNERCLFCYMGDVLTYETTSMPKLVVDATSAQLRKTGTYQVSILGGEPLMYKNLDYMLCNLDDAGINVSLSTNGTVLNKEVFRKLTDMNVRLNFSFHSHIPAIQDRITNLTGSFDKAIRTLTFLKSINHPPHISIVTNALNIDSIAETVGFVCDLGVTAISIYHAMKSGFSANDQEIGVTFKEYIKALDKAKLVGNLYGAKVRAVTNFPFLADQSLVFDRTLGKLSNFFYGTTDGRRAIYINYDGTVYATSYLFGNRSFAMGNVVIDDLVDMWNNSPAIEQFRTASPPLQCNSCKHFDICRGGPISNYTPTLLRKTQSDAISCPLNEESISE